MEKIKRKSGIRYRPKVYILGKPYTSTFTRKADADDWETIKRNEKKQIEKFGAPVITNITLLDFSKIWFGNKPDLARSSIKSYQSALSCYLLPAFGHMLLRDIRLGHAQSLICSMREKKLSPSRMKLTIGFLKTLLSDAIRWDYLIYDPLKNLSRIKVPPSPEVFWLHDELIAFLNANREDEHYYLYATAMNTGMRISELFGLTWDKIDFDENNGQVIVSCQRNRHGIVNRTKNGKILHFPLDVTLRRILSDLKKENRSSDYVFVKRNGDMINPEHFSERVFRKAIERANLKIICFRNLRTSFATNFCLDGGDIYAACRLLNHSSVEMTAKKYAHLNLSHLKKAVGIVSYEADSPQTVHGHLQLVASD